MDELEQGMHDLCMEQEMLVRWERDKVLDFITQCLIGAPEADQDIAEFTRFVDELIHRVCCYESTLASTELMDGVMYERADWSAPLSERLVKQ